MTNERLPYTDLLVLARSALQRGQASDAIRLYRQCLDQGAPVASELAGSYFQSGNFTAARDVLDIAIAREPECRDEYFQRGLVSMAIGQPAQARADFDHFVLLVPSFAPAYFQRGLAHLGLHQFTDALTDFRQAAQLQPDMVEAWTNMGVLMLRTGDATGAVHALRTADRHTPGRPQILQALASAYDGAGEVASALALFARLEPTASNTPDFLTNHALCLLRGGQPDAAYQRFKRALRLVPGDQTALAGLYIAANALGYRDEVDVLMDFDALVHATASHPASALDMEALRHAVGSHPGLAWEPAGRSTVGGQQTVMLDLARGSEFHALGEAMAGHVADRMTAIAASPALADHPWRRTAPRRWRLQMWATVLHDGGHQTPHIHPAGWMSGVFYLDAGQPTTAEEGSLVFGHPQAEFAQTASPRSLRHQPRSGEVLLFPSYFFHHTIPYNGPTARISLAFDVVPE